MASDYTDAKTYSSERASVSEEIEARLHPAWWLADDEAERCKNFIDMARDLRLAASARHEANLRHARLYENVELDTLSSSDFALSVVQQAIRGRGLVRMNIVASALDTLAAKVVKNKPRGEFLTSGGDWKKQQKARRLSRFERGLYYEVQLYEKAKDVFFDGGIFGIGFLKLFFNDEKRLEVERVLPDEIFVDDGDALRGKPRTLLHRKVIQREMLLAMFPKKKEAIYGAPAPSDAASKKGHEVTPAVEVWEGWHLPTKKGAGDGKHVIAIDKHELLCEGWEMDRFPFVMLHGPCGRGGRGRTVGMWGKGVAEALTGIQIELNRLIFSVSEQLRRKGKGRIFVQIGSKVVPDHLTNNVADIIQYTGQPPHVDNQNAVSQEEFLQIDRLKAAAFQEIGLSELSVAAKKPAGLDAAVALREYSDIESERFALIHQAWEQFFMAFTETALSMIRTFGDGGYKVRLPNRRYVQEIDWKDINLDRDGYVQQMLPVSSLPDTKAAKYQTVKEWQADGFIDKPTAQRLLNFPDLDAESNLGNAAIDDVDATISAILDEEDAELLPVEPYQNLELLVTRATAAYLFARHHECPENRLEMLRQLIADASAQRAKLMAPPPGMPLPGAGAPPPGVAPGMAGPPPGGLPPGMMANITNTNVQNGGVQPVAPPMVQ